MSETDKICIRKAAKTCGDCAFLQRDGGCPPYSCMGKEDHIPELQLEIDEACERFVPAGEEASL